MRLQEIIFKYVLKRQPKRQIQMRNWQDVRTVAIIHDCNNIDTIVRDIVKGDRAVDVFTTPIKNEVNWLTAAPKSALKKQLMQRQYDLLLDLTQNPTITLQYMAMYVRADFKVGKYVEENIYDLNISTPTQESPNFLYQQMIKYIEMFNQK